jgi:acyl phosphate:glycerol-3-phosphate acyltransferase
LCALEDLFVEITLYSPTVLFGTALSFLIGSIPVGYALVRLILKKDVRQEGSGNIGATNVARVAGKNLGILTLVLDVSKGLACVLTAQALSLTMDVAALWGLFAFLGHCFTPFLKFNGGKGVATGLGVLVILVPQAAIAGLVAFLMGYIIIRKVSLGSLVGAPVALTVTWMLNTTVMLQVCVTLLVLILIFRHKSNISRLMQRKELSL